MQHIILYPNFIIDAYEKPHADLLDSQPHEFPARWNEMYGSLKIAHHAILLIGGTFIAIVLGLLQSSSLAADYAITCLGIICVLASLFSLAYNEVYSIFMSRISNPWRGLAWVQASKDLPTSSWKSAPRLLAVPAIWMLWASIALFAFILAEVWASSNDVSSATPSPPLLKIVLSVLVTLELVAGVVQATYVISAFDKLCKAAIHTRGGIAHPDEIV